MHLIVHQGSPVDGSAIYALEKGITMNSQNPSINGLEILKVETRQKKLTLTLSCNRGGWNQSLNLSSPIQDLAIFPFPLKTIPPFPNNEFIVSPFSLLLRLPSPS